MFATAYSRFEVRNGTRTQENISINPYSRRPIFIQHLVRTLGERTGIFTWEICAPSVLQLLNESSRSGLMASVPWQRRAELCHDELNATLLESLLHPVSAAGSAPSMSILIKSADGQSHPSRKSSRRVFSTSGLSRSHKLSPANNCGGRAPWDSPEAYGRPSYRTPPCGPHEYAELADGLNPRNHGPPQSGPPETCAANEAFGRSKHRDETCIILIAVPVSPLHFTSVPIPGLPLPPPPNA